MKNSATKSDENGSSQNDFNQEIEQDGNRDLIQKLEENVQTTSEKGQYGFNSNTQFCAAKLDCCLSNFSIRSLFMSQYSKSIFFVVRYHRISYSNFL